MQAAGRSGRAQDHGEVVFQVYHPDHYAVSCAAQQDYESFFVNEMHFRHAGMYPPYTYMTAVTFSGMDPSRTEAAAMEFKRALSGNFKVIGVLQLLRINDRSRCRILLKGKDPQEMRTAVRKVLDQGIDSKVSVKVDVDPMTLD
jgi:primosomal protein N' (replication factor Y)